MIPLAMVVINEFLERPTEMALTVGQHPIEALYLIDCTNRSAWAFALGA
jgi:hypothetical protein